VLRLPPVKGATKGPKGSGDKTSGTYIHGVYIGLTEGSNDSHNEKGHDGDKGDIASFDRPSFLLNEGGGAKTPQVTSQNGTKSALSQHQVAILLKCLIANRITELMNMTGRTDRTKFRNQVLNPLLQEGLLEMTIPEKPTSSNQKYRLTSKGRNLIAELPTEAGADEK